MLYQVLDQIRRKFNQIRYAPAIEVDHTRKLLRLGSKYGGWVLEPSPDLKGAVILSCGLGEDASFDVEFASKFEATVIVVDPTPRALRHFEDIQKHLGERSRQRYLSGGCQPVAAYDLSRIKRETLIIEPFALWTEETTLKFFVPANPEHVSHSLVHGEDSSSGKLAFIEVAATTVGALLEKHSLRTLPLIKLDVEGAEIPVIDDMFEKSIYPRQILIEFDEMNSPSPKNKARVEDADAKLRKTGYSCCFHDGSGNFLYVREHTRSS